MLSGLGIISAQRGDASAALDYFDRALLIWDARGNIREQAVVLNNMAGVQMRQQHFAGALALLEKAMPLHKQTGAVSNTGLALSNMARVHHDQGNLAQAHALHREGLRHLRSAGTRVAEAYTLGDLGLLDAMLSNWESAHRNMSDSTAIMEECANPLGLGCCHCMWTSVWLVLGEALAEGQLNQIPTVFAAECDSQLRDADAVLQQAQSQFRRAEEQAALLGEGMMPELSGRIAVSKHELAEFEQLLAGRGTATDAT